MSQSAKNSTSSKRKQVWWDHVMWRVSKLRNQKSFGETVGIYLIDTPDRLIIIDGPSSQAGLIEVLKQQGKPITVVLTHGPTFNESQRLVEQLGATVLLHELDRTNRWLGGNAKFCTFWSGESHKLAPGVALYHTGGHSQGHCFVYDAETPGILFTGDEIYADDNDVLELEDELRQEPVRGQYLRKLDSILGDLPFENAFPLHGNAFSNASNRIAALLKSNG